MSSDTHCGAQTTWATSGPESVGTSTLSPMAGEYGPGSRLYSRPYRSKLTAIIMPIWPDYVVYRRPDRRPPPRAPHFLWPERTVVPRPSHPPARTRRPSPGGDPVSEVRLPDREEMQLPHADPPGVEPAGEGVRQQQVMPAGVRADHRLPCIPLGRPAVCHA